MYTDNDLNQAVDNGVFSAHDVENFRQYIQKQRNVTLADEEKFKLVTSFNDIFVILACGLLLFSVWYSVSSYGTVVSGTTLAGLSWILSEFFVRKRKMALPGIGLLITFAYGLLAASMPYQPDSPMEMIFSLVVVSVGAVLHWKRFRVPVTVAVMTASMIGLVFALLLSLLPDDYIQNSQIITWSIFTAGVLLWCIAMYWDSRDTKRISYRSDVAFWLHLSASPLIVHSTFLLLGVWDFDSNTQMSILLPIVLLYLVISCVSLVIDRRAMMVSALGYVVYALSNLLDQFADVDSSFTVTVGFIGAALLVVSVYWRSLRKLLVVLLPESVRRFVPEVQ